jgi:Flp pilus assembly protein TadD/transglutaminase-like putative cysteine protease
MRSGFQRIRFGTLVFAFLFAIPVIAQGRLAAHLQAATAKPTVSSATPTPADYPQEPFVVERYDMTARFENDGTGERDLRVRIHVNSDAGVQQLGELVFGFNSANEQMDVRFVRVQKPDGTTVTATPDAVKELTAPVASGAPVYTDYKEKHITVPALAPGATLEYEIVTRLLTPLAPNEFWFDHNFLEGAIVLDENFVLNVPSDSQIQLESANFQYEKTQADGRTIYHWKHSNLKRLTDEEKAKQKEKDDSSKQPDIQLTTFTSWEAVARWYAKLEEGRAQPDAQIREKALALTQGRATMPEKAEALYDYVSQNIRYVSLSFGLGRYQPHSAAEVFANQYGDCKDKHTLLAAMLQAVGIPSDAVLIPYSRKLELDFPSPSQFDHVITAIPDGTSLIWMDSTAEVAPFRLLTSPLRDKSALLVPPDGDGRIVETPADPPFLSTQQVEIEGQVDDLGKLTGHVHYTLRGDTEFLLRAAFRKTPETQWKELGQTVLTLDGLRGEVSAVKPSDPTATEKPFELDVEFSQPNFLDWSAKKARIAVPLLNIGLPDAPDDNTKPIELGSPLDVSTRLRLTLPASFVAQPPVAISVSHDFADFKTSYEFQDHVLTATRALNFKMRELPASRTDEYLAFTRAVTADESQPLLVENSTTGAPAIPSTAKPGELLESGLAALNSGNERAAIPLLKRVVELEPQHKEAWNDLGLAYLRIGEFDEAVSAFQSQLKVNPYDEHSYNYLGIAFQQQQKFDEAVNAYRKQINLNPLDPVAHAALGGLLLSQHKYSDAIPELEKATVLTPDSADLQVSLGQAYLNTGDKEKALAAFQKGVDLAQTPLVWNNVAYSLADNKLDLDRAQQYAESAASSAAATLRNVNLAHLTLDDLNEVTAIGSYWDTLGWVYFNRGDLEKAQRYIDAAWKLNQHGEVADHLARIAEKRGDKQEAIRLYAIAIAAPASVPETRARLTLLLGGNSQIDGLVSHARPELEKLRSFEAGKLLPENLSADFYFLLSPAGEDGKTSVVDAVQFVRGSEKLRPFAENLRRLDFGTLFPDASPVKLIRRGTLTCSSATEECTLLLALPESVRTIN